MKAAIKEFLVAIKIFKPLIIIKESSQILIGFLFLILTRKTPAFSYQAMVRLFCLTGGVSNDFLSKILSTLNPPKSKYPVNGVLQNITQEKMGTIQKQLNDNGYFIFDAKLPQETCDRVMKYALEEKGYLESSPQTLKLFNRSKPEGVRFAYRPEDLIKNVDFQALVADQTIQSIAREYLQCEPILDNVSLWWSTAFQKEPDQLAAQYFHFDMDRIKWLKFFIYITDVNTHSGPHCFISKSQRAHGIPPQLLKKGYSRLTDEEVLQYFPKNDFIEFSAPRGTIIAEDTRGLHKGKHVLEGDRLVLGLEFTNSLFGSPYSYIPAPSALNPEFQKMMNERSRFLSSFTYNQ